MSESTTNSDSRALARVPSLVPSSPKRPEISSIRGRIRMSSTVLGRMSPPSTGKGEIVPDSEEERIHSRVDSLPLEEEKENRQCLDVIEISSDEDDDVQTRFGAMDDPFISRIPGAWPMKHVKPTPTAPSPIRSRNVRFTKKPVYRARVVVSSSSDDSDQEHAPRGQISREIIELTDSSPERTSHRSPVKQSVKSFSKGKQPEDEIVSSSEANEASMGYGDDAILTLDEPRSTRKPIRIASIPYRDSPTSITIPASSRGILTLNTNLPRHNEAFSLTADPTPIGTPSQPRPALDPLQTPQSDASPTKARKPRVTKKSQAAAEQARREAYALKLFAELNTTVFADALPKETKLNWNKRLLTTAGRAKWHRSKEGIETTEIELADKILDCDERIRNTLSHEMCHLACWVINRNTVEAHGMLWKGWAHRVMKKRPDIEVTTRHSYDIKYPFEWECEKCAKIYGRFSKSIRPDECVCGACKEGRLMPLFTAKRAPKTPKATAGSRMATAKAQDSPLGVGVGATPTRASGSKESRYNDNLDVDPDSDSEVEILATTFGGVRISEKQ